MESIGLMIGVALGGGLIGFGIYYLIIHHRTSHYSSLKTQVDAKLATVEADIATSKAQAQQVTHQAQQDAQKITLSAQDQAIKTKEYAQAESDKIMLKLDQIQSKLEDKESKIDAKYEQLDILKEQLTSKQALLDASLHTQQSKLEEIAQLTVGQAEKEYSSDVMQIVDKYSSIVFAVWTFINMVASSNSF